ncbi:MAG: hypothetical protein IJC99_05530 [Clostridia bacterium]|nr:hypothetical protein [Clostridia bacterium]
MNLLFIGNSHTYFNDMAATVKQLLEATGERTHVTMLTRGGKGLVHHMTDPNTLFNIRYGGYDTVIAQERAAGFDQASFTEGAEALARMSAEAGARFLLFMPWVRRDERSTQRDMTEAYLSFARKQGCRFAPCGETFTRLLTSLKADDLYCEDGNHATALGSYAAAVTIFYTVTGRKRTIDPTKIDDPGILSGLTPALCARIHAEACFATRLFNG